MQAGAPTDTADQFAQEVIQGHHEAFAALRAVLAAAIKAATPPDGSSQPAGLSAPLARTLTLAFRAANAILRTQPRRARDDGDAEPAPQPPRPLSRDDVLLIAASQGAGKKYLPLQVVPRLKAWQQYADRMGFPAPFDFPPDLLDKFPGRPEPAPLPQPA